tara:strand:+ start:450 stop:674 length:225 start_codon:yes stop_codon:yes gene_type:complete
MSKHRPECVECGESFQQDRKAIGYDTCTSCGEQGAGLVKHTIVPMHKSNYIHISNTEIGRQLLKGINSKGGFYR